MCVCVCMFVHKCAGLFLLVMNIGGFFDRDANWLDDRSVAY